MKVARRKALKTKRYELGFQLTIDWCVLLSLYAVLLPLCCSASGDNVQKIHKKTDEGSLYDVHLINDNFKQSTSEKYESSTMYERLGTPEKLVSNNNHNNDMDPWKIINFAIENAQEVDGKGVSYEKGEGVRSGGMKVNESTNLMDGVIETTTVGEEVTTVLDSTTTAMSSVYGTSDFYSFESMENITFPDTRTLVEIEEGSTTPISNDVSIETTTIVDKIETTMFASSIQVQNSANISSNVLDDIVNSTSESIMYSKEIKPMIISESSTIPSIKTTTKSIRKNKNRTNSTRSKNRLRTNVEENDSRENIIEDSNHKKKKKPSKNRTCLHCTIQRRVLDVGNETKPSNETDSSMSKNTSSIIMEFDIDDEDSSTEKLTTEDYNISYELEDSDEDLMVIKAKKNATEEPLTFAPLNNLRDFASGLVESFYERVIPKGIRDIVRRLQEQNEKLETYNLRSKEENGGLGQFGRSIIKGLSAPINQVMQGVRDYGSLDSDRNFLAGVASSVVSLADSVGESFRERVRAIYPGTLWCGDGHMAQSAEVGLFFMTDSCCQKHDSCKYYIAAGETKYGLTNTGIFTRSHCECDKAFFRCLRKTNSLVSSQIGVTYFSILGPQCFKRDYPIIKCLRRTRITGQKCEKYLLDYSQPKTWQWFDNETF